MAIYVALYASLDPQQEVSGAGYQRQHLGQVVSGPGDTVTNDAVITFTPTGNWGPIIGVGYYDEQRFCCAGHLTRPMHVQSGDTVLFARHSLTVSPALFIPQEDMRILLQVFLKDHAPLNPPPQQPKKTLWERLLEDEA